MTKAAEVYAGEVLDPKTRAPCTVAVYAGFPTAWSMLAAMGRALEAPQPPTDTEE